MCVISCGVCMCVYVRHAYLCVHVHVCAACVFVCACACVCGMCVYVRNACVCLCMCVCVRHTCVCGMCVCDGASAPLCDGARTRPFFFGCLTLSACMSKNRSNWTISPATQFWYKSHAMPTPARARLCPRACIPACVPRACGCKHACCARARILVPNRRCAAARIGRDCVHACRVAGRAWADGHSRNKPTRVLCAARRGRYRFVLLDPPPKPLQRQHLRIMPHLHRDWARPCDICARTGLTPPTPAKGLGSTVPHLRWDWAQ